MPVNSYRLDDLRTMIVDRMQRDACGANIQLGLDATGAGVALVVSGGTGCTMGVTGVSISSQSVCPVSLLHTLVISVYLSLHILTCDRESPWNSMVQIRALHGSHCKQIKLQQ